LIYLDEDYLGINMAKIFEIFILTEVVKDSNGKILSSKDFMEVHPDAELIIDEILEKYGRHSVEFFNGLENSINQVGIWPWAIILFNEEFRLAGHVVSVRKKREDFSFTAYTLLPGTTGKGVPPVSVLLINNKVVLEQAAMQSQLFNEAWVQLADKPEDQHWVCIVDSPSADWITQNSQGDDQLFMSIFGA
jgi:hypothetical protein